MTATVTERLADGLFTREISLKDCHRASLLVLDWTACAVAGAHGQFGDNLSQLFSSESGSCTRIGSKSSGPLSAAFHNGCLGNVLEMDDVDKQAILHAGPTIIPAAMAVGEYIEAAPHDVLKAIVVGYETTIRIGRAVGAGHYAYWHNTATCGPFGAASAACFLLQTSQAELVSALGLAGTQAAGLWQTRHEAASSAKQVHAGHAAQVGVHSAFLASNGIQGPKWILEGEQGFFKAMCPGANAEDVLKAYENDWLIHKTSVKPYPSCRHAHPVIDAILKSGATTQTVKSWPIVIETYEDAIKFCDNPNPVTPSEAMFSLQHVAAVTLRGEAPKLSDFNAKAIEDPANASVRQKIQIRASEIYQTQYPKHFGARVIIDGKTTGVKDAYGDPENPMSEKAVVDKAQNLFGYAGMSATRSDALCEAARNFITLDSIKSYTDLLP